MDTILSQLKKDIESLKELFSDFLLKHSRINYRPQSNSDDFVIFGSDYDWDVLDSEGKRIQNRLLKEYNIFIDLATALLVDSPKEAIFDFEDTTKNVLEYIEQDEQIWVGTTQEVLNKVISMLDSQYIVLSTIYDLSPGSCIVVPDTNALLTNPNIEKWDFQNLPKFEILITPTVASELDKLKILHNNKEVREKCQSIIRRFKEYRRRGRLVDGVIVVKNKVYLRAMAVEPNFERTLSWLDLLNNDDRVIATFIEVMRQHPNSSIILVTADFNLQNKAEFARIPFVEPPAEI